MTAQPALAAADAVRGTLMRPDMYSISSFHSLNSSGRPTTMLAILAPRRTAKRFRQPLLLSVHI